MHARCRIVTEVMKNTAHVVPQAERNDPKLLLSWPQCQSGLAISVAFEVVPDNEGRVKVFIRNVAGRL